MKIQTRTIPLDSASSTVALSFLLLVAAFILWPTYAKADVHSHYQPNVLVQAERALDRGKPDLTLQLLQQRSSQLASASMRAQAHALVCKAHFKKRNIVAAERACDEAVKNGNEVANWSDLNNRGVMRLLLGKLEKAQKDFQKALVANSSSRAVRRNLNLLKRQLGLKKQLVNSLG